MLINLSGKYNEFRLKFKSSTIFEFLVVISFVVILLSCILYIGFNFIQDFTRSTTIDSVFYFKMSYNPFEITDAPFMYRILTPFIVSLIPFKHLNGFILVNLTGLTLTATLFYYYLKKLDLKTVNRFIGISLFLFAPTILYSLYDIVSIDILSFLFFLLAFYAILCKKDNLYLFAMFLGILNKEIILITLPLYFLYKLENNNLSNALKSTILMMIPIMILFIGIRYYFGFTSYFSLITIKQVILYHLYFQNLLINIYLAFGTLWIISLFTINYVKNRFLKKSLIILPFVFLQAFLMTDIFRGFFIMFPILIPISLYLFNIRSCLNIIIFQLLSILVLIYYLISIILKYHLVTFMNLPLEFIIFMILPLEILIFLILMRIILRNCNL